ncbi:regulator of G-protein signaling 4-like isoform X1 [Sinocyclocheilus rhinocerous]|uniref:regulator of G-protein signaling 4-like isoform X1 n=1 Tax=Sinocyclocheilus rhinocerous TaxID=307959 RepID=UPI0007B963D8|nr:PREDICTED: regulator of G-protein signaling 4-like isoform X1 [Sinocyclocheilus rhinocerous]
MCKGLAALPATCLKSAKDIKHKIGFLLQKPDPPQDQKTLKDKEKEKVVNRVPIAEIEKWKTSFNNLIKNEDGLKAFTSFSQSEYSQENIEFWEACEDFKQTSVDKMNVKARKIFERYVEVDSPSEVNLDSATRELTRKNLERCDSSCFEEAQSKIFTLMEKDSYRRFLKSKLFLELSQPLLDNKPCSLEKKGKRHISDHGQCLPSYA